MARKNLRLIKPGEYRPDWSQSARGGGISPIFLALLAGFAASGFALYKGYGSNRAGVFIFVLCGWLISLCLHEFMHAAAAYWGGDHTVARKGYLRLDPRAYGHPVLTFVLPLFFLLIGGLPLPGGAVAIESHRLRGKWKDSLVSAAGPAVNVVFSIVLLVVLGTWGPPFIFTPTVPDHAALWSALTFLAYIQIASAILNLLPIPGLDGYGIIEPFLSADWRRIGAQIAPYGILIVFALLYALGPDRNFIAQWTHDILSPHSPPNGYFYGYNLFKFWGSVNG
ncbi:site-2 protease family protein [Catenulispora rubra]|uniref:site-2 protease family protein n=1 Tax=Catenulispora rubra TaxID=280293 RepID=UPI0018927C32|nr:site-2 protease family protein [Catenulispora rubra]